MPVFRASHQLRSQGIALDITSDGQEMLIGLDRKRLEAALIDRPSPGGVMMGMPALRMGDGDPAEHLGEFAILSRPEEEMPVIGHQAIGGDADLGLGLGFGENLLERGVVSGLFKERQPSYATIQHVIGKISSSKAGAARHTEACTESTM